MGVGDDLIGDLEQRLVTQVLHDRSLFRMSGPSSQAWRAETELAAAYPGTQCLLLPSASVGLTLLLEVLDLEPGSEVLITPFGWLANWACIRRAGLEPRFLPLDEDLQLRPEAVAQRIGERTGAVIVTHLMGRGQQEVAQIAQLCERRGVILLEDIAQSFGVSVDGQRTGTFGTGAWCSLNHHKILSTGDGGFVAVSDEDLFARLSALHDQGCIITGGKRRPASDLQPGLSLRVNDLTAAVLRAQLARYPWLRARIGRLNEAMERACRAADLEVLPASPGDVPFTALFRRPAGLDYPSLLDSGWHIAPQVSWLEDDFATAAADDLELKATLEHLGAVSALGSGFIDPYYAIPLGLEITATPDAADLVLQELRHLP